MDVGSEQAICVPMKKVKAREELTWRDGTEYINFKDMNNWIATDPDSWAEIQAYIKKLRNIVENHCNE